MASRVPGGRALGFAEARPMHRTPHSPTRACHHIMHFTTPQRMHTNTRHITHCKKVATPSMPLPNASSSSPAAESVQVAST